MAKALVAEPLKTMLLFITCNTYLFLAFPSSSLNWDLCTFASDMVEKNRLIGDFEIFENFEISARVFFLCIVMDINIK